jgi:hypothetical protein
LGQRTDELTLVTHLDVVGHYDVRGRIRMEESQSGILNWMPCRELRDRRYIIDTVALLKMLCCDDYAPSRMMLGEVEVKSRGWKRYN